MVRTPILIGICGGTGSGKTTLVNKLFKAFGKSSACLIQQDNYYKDLAHMPIDVREKINFDESAAIDIDLLIGHLLHLKNFVGIKQPCYDFKGHLRSGYTEVEPKEIVLIEGILILAIPELRNLLDIKIYLEIDNDICFIRRLQRDIAERGSSVNSVVEQYVNTVKPMHLKYVVANKKYADLVIGKDSSIEEIVAYVREKINLGSKKLLFNEFLW